MQPYDAMHSITPQASRRKQALEYAGVLLLLSGMIVAFAAQCAHQAYYEYCLQQTICDDRDVNRLLTAAEQGSPADIDVALRAGAEVDG